MNTKDFYQAQRAFDNQLPEPEQPEATFVCRECGHPKPESERETRWNHVCTDCEEFNKQIG